VGALIGYARVSTREQDPGTQEDALRSAGAVRVFTDHGESSRRTDRPQWTACLDYLRDGDTLLVYRLDRLAGSQQQMLQIFDELERRSIDLRSLTEPAIDTTSPMGRAFYSIIAVFAQLRVDTIRQNTRDGLARARAEGRVGGRPTVMTPERVALAKRLRGEGMPYRQIASALGVSHSAVARALQPQRAEATPESRPPSPKA